MVGHLGGVRPSTESKFAAPAGIIIISISTICNFSANCTVLKDQKSISFNFVTITRETKQLLALLLPKLTGHSLILFHHVMKNGLPLNRLIEREWTFSSVKTIKKYLNEPPWMTQHLKALIRQRQKALVNGRDQLFKSLRNRVNRERKQCRSEYFDSKVSQLKVPDPKQW